MSKHTPGPWKATRDDFGLCGVKRRSYRDDFLTLQHLINTSRGFPDGENVFNEAWANAKLIAAAPELAEAVMKLESAIALVLQEEGCSAIDVETDYPELKAACDFADNTLKKAGVIS